MSGANARPVKLSISAGTMKVSLQDKAGGYAEEDIAVEYNQDSIEIGFSPRYIMDICGQIDGDEMTIALDNPGAPALIRDGGNARSLFVMMPMKAI